MKSLPLMFLCFLFVEFAAIILVGGKLGVLLTLVAFFGSSFIGMTIIRWQGAESAMRVGNQMRQGVMPYNAMSQGIILVVAGIFLVIPGFVTDFLGMILFCVGLLYRLFGSSRHEVSSHKSSDRYDSQPSFHQSSHHGQPDSDGKFTKTETRKSNVIDGEYRRED